MSDDPIRQRRSFWITPELMALAGPHAIDLDRRELSDLDLGRVAAGKPNIENEILSRMERYPAVLEGAAQKLKSLSSLGGGNGGNGGNGSGKNGRKSGG